MNFIIKTLDKTQIAIYDIAEYRISIKINA